MSTAQRAEMRSVRHVFVVATSLLIVCSACSLEELPPAHPAEGPERGLDPESPSEPELEPEPDGSAPLQVAPDKQGFAKVLCARLREYCFASLRDQREAEATGWLPPSAEICPETLLAQADAADVTFDANFAQRCEKEGLWSMSLSCGAVFKRANARAPGAACNDDLDCANDGPTAGLCIAADGVKKCALVERGKLGDACLGQSGVPLQVTSSFVGAVCMRGDHLYCDGSGHCAERRGLGEACTKEHVPLFASPECVTGTWCQGGSCVGVESIDAGDVCPLGMNGVGDCLRPPGSTCSEGTFGGGIPYTDCAGWCLGGRCEVGSPDLKGVACGGFTTAHSFDL